MNPRAGAGLWRRLSGRGGLAAGGLAFRLSGLAARFVVTVYISHYIGFDSLAVYGFIVGGSAAMVSIGGLGLDYQMGRFVVAGPLPDLLPRIRDRMLMRLVISALVIGCGYAVMDAIFAVPPIIPLAALLIVAGEPLIYDIQQVLVYRRPVLANALLFIRSAGWVPPVIGLGLLDPAWRSMDLILVGWSASILLSLAVVILPLLSRSENRQALSSRPDFGWLMRDGFASKLVYVSELGIIAILYADRFIISLLLGNQAAGAFVFIWSFTNSLVPLVQASIFNQLTPMLTVSWRESDRAGWLRQLRRGIRATATMGFVLGVLVFALVTVLLPLGGIGKENVNVSLTLLMTLATVIRLTADVYQAGLYSAEKDRLWVRINIMALVFGPPITLLSVAAFGIIGAGMQMVLLSLGLLVLRHRALAPVLAGITSRSPAKPGSAPPHSLYRQEDKP